MRRSIMIIMGMGVGIMVMGEVGVEGAIIVRVIVRGRDGGGIRGWSSCMYITMLKRIWQFCKYDICVYLFVRVKLYHDGI